MTHCRGENSNASQLSYVKWIQGNDVTIFCENNDNEDFLENIGAKKNIFQRKIWSLHCDNENDLAEKLQTLNDHHFMFVGGLSGWNPADIYVLMRDKKLVTGEVSEIVWNGLGEPVTRNL